MRRGLAGALDSLDPPRAGSTPARFASASNAKISSEPADSCAKMVSVLAILPDKIFALPPLCSTSGWMSW